MIFRSFVLAFVASSGAADAVAQSPLSHRLPGGQSVELRDGEMVIQAQRGLTLGVSSSDEATTRQDDALKMIYRMVDRDCGLLLETIADACELMTLNVSSTLNARTRIDSESQSVNASATFYMKIRLKGVGGPPR